MLPTRKTAGSLVVLATWLALRAALPAPTAFTGDGSEAEKPPDDSVPQPSQRDNEDAFMGEYAGTCVVEGDTALAARGMVVARLDKKTKQSFYLVRLIGHKPKQPYQAKLEVELRGRVDGDKVVLADGDGRWAGVITEKAMIAVSKDEKPSGFDLRYTVRESPAAGKAPPEGAVVLLPYEPGKPASLEKWTNKTWRPLADGSVEVGKGDQRTKDDLGAVRLHVEFRCPFEPRKTGQGRGNSGVYLMDRYEVQVLDSFGLESKSNDCGGVYKIAAPRVNACLPPGRWQTYDITFRPAVFDEAGELTKDPVVTVVHNGVTIHENQEVPRATAGGRGGNHPAKGPLRLQDHGSKVRYRNIWYVPLRD